MAVDGTPTAKRHGSPPPGGELHEHRDCAVRLRPRLGEEAVGHLALHHHAPALQRRCVLEGLDHERGRDVVREVGDELCGFGLELVDRELERVSPDESERSSTRRARRATPARASDRARSSGRAARSARRRVRMPRPGPTSSTTSVERRSLESLDHTEDVLVDEEVLAERLLGRDGQANPNAAAAFAWVWAARSSTSSSRASARTRDRVHHVGRLVPCAAHRLRRKVWAVGLDEDPVRRNSAGGLAQRDRVRKRHVAGERDVVATLDCGHDKPGRRETVEDHRAGKSGQERRPSRRPPRDCGSTTGRPSSSASASCASKRRRCSSGVAKRRTVSRPVSPTATAFG